MTDDVYAATASVRIPTGTGVPGCENTNSCYSPYSVSINVGDTVIWTNGDTAAHTVTSGGPAGGPDGTFDSSLFMFGANYLVTFLQAGTYPYYCAVHPWMQGEVNVQGAPSIEYYSLQVSVSPSTVLEDEIAVISGQLFASQYISGYEVSVTFETDTGLSGGGWVLDGGQFNVNVQWPVGVHTITYYFESDAGTLVSNPVVLTVKSPEGLGTSISLDPFTSSITVDDTIFLSGRLTTGGGVPIYSKTIWIQADSDNGRGVGGSAITDSGGYFTTELGFSEYDIANWTVYAKFDGDSEYKKSSSTARLLTVTSAAPTPPPPAPAGTDVEAPLGSALPGCEDTDSCFSPSTISVDVGDTVTWYNADTAAHTVTSGAGIPDGIFDSSLFMSGASFSHTFSQAGTYPYFCMVHPWMSGEVIVNEEIIQESIFVSTDRTSYQSGDNIFVTGQTTTIDIGVTILVTAPNGNIISVAQVYPSSSGTFSTQLTSTAGTLWEQTGTYTIAVQQGTTNSASTTFYFENTTTPPLICGPDEVLVGGVCVSAFDDVTTISVFTDRTSYTDGDTIRISGNVGTLIENAPVSIIIINPVGSIAAIAQAYPSSDGSYSTTAAAGGAMNSDGTYTVKVTYGGPNRTAETSFYFSGITIPTSPTTGQSVSVEGFEVGYQITGGSILAIYPDIDQSSLIIEISASSSGKLTITLPRELIDAKIGSSDDNFFVLVDKEEVYFNESKTLRDRTLTISFSSGTEEIEILGTILNPYKSAPAPTQPSPTPTPPPAPAGTDVEITLGSGVPGCETTNSCYSPSTISVDVGDTVTWYNADTAAHTVTSGSPADGPDGVFDSSLFMSGTSFSHTFTQSGTYPYFAMNHPWVIGTVIVKGKIISQSDAGTLRINDYRFTISKYNPAEVILSGEVTAYSKGTPVLLQLTYPDGSVVEQKILVSSAKNFGVSLFLDESYPTGSYTITAQYDSIDFMPISFQAVAEDDTGPSVQYYSLTASVSPSTVFYGEVSVISGQLHASQYIPGYEISVKYDTDTGLSGGQWVLDGGHFNINALWPSGVHTITFYFESDAGTLVSNPVTLTVKSPEGSDTSISLDPFTSSITVDDTIFLSGRLTTIGGVPIYSKTIWVQADSDNGRGVGASGITDSEGYFTTELGFSEYDIANWTVYAKFEGDSEFVTSSSNTRQLTVTSAVPKISASVLVLDPLPTKVNRGDFVIMTGRLQTESGIPITFRTVNLVSDNDSTVAASTTTDSIGQFAFSWDVRYSYTTYRWYVEFIGDDQFTPSNSAVQSVSITLRPELYFTPLPNRVDVGTTLTFSGQLTAEGLPLAGKTVYIKDDVDFGTDTNLGSATTDQNGEFSATWDAVPRSSGAYDFYAVFEGDSEAFRVRSATYSVYVTVTMVFEPVRVYTEKTVFSEGDSLRVYGSATPNEELEIALMDSRENIITQKSIRVDSTGSFSTVLFTWQSSFNVNFGDYGVVAWSPIDMRYDGVWVSFIKLEPDTFQTKITLNRPQASVIIGQPITFTGQLLTVNGEPLSGQLIEIGTKIDGNLVNLENGYTDSSGRFSINWNAQYLSSSATIPVFAFYTGNQIFETSISDGYSITIEKPTLSVSTSATEFQPGDTIVVYGDGTPGDRISVSIRSNSGQVVASEIVSVGSDGSYAVILFLSTTSSDGIYTVTASSSNFNISDSTQISIKTVIPETISIRGIAYYGEISSHNDLSGLKTVLKIGENYQTDYTDSSGNFEFNNIRFDPKVEYLLWFEMTDGKSFNFVDGNKYNPNKFENPSAEGRIITSHAIQLPIDRTKSINNFNINLSQFLPYSESDSYIITKGFDTQTKIVDFYSKDLGERPPIINIFLFKEDGWWYWSTVWDPQTGKVDSQYQPRINIQRTIGFDAFGMEYTHYTQDYAYYKMNGYDTQPKGEDGCNHCGFNNESTADSWVEGVGRFLPAVIKYRENLPEPGKFGGIDLELNIFAPNSDKIGKYYSNGKLIWKDEEYSIATLLWDMYDNRNDGENISLSIGQVWNLIKGFDNYQRHNPSFDSEDRRHIKYFKDFYDYLVENSNIPKNDIDDLFALHSIPDGWAAGKYGRP